MIFSNSTYGQDADGNRGYDIEEYELEDSAEEREEIAMVLYEDFVSLMFNLNKFTTITYDGCEIEVCPGEYLDELIELVKKDDEQGEEEIREIENEYNISIRD
jgi:hypothetical protein